MVKNLLTLLSRLIAWPSFFLPDDLLQALSGHVTPILLSRKF